MKLVLAGGGTAGHVHPALATAVELQRRHPDWEFLFLGTATGLESRLVPEHGFALSLIPRTPLPRRLTADLLRFPIDLIRTVRAVYQALRGADLLIGFGGYVAAPAYIAARLHKIPIVVHEQNAKPGFANRLGARLTSHVAVSFANTILPHALLTGLPLHAKVLDAAATKNRVVSLMHLGLDEDRPLLLVTGGSQGSQRINSAIEACLDDLISDGWQVLHAVGEKNQLPLAKTHYRPVHYLNEMEMAMQAADLLIGRSGAVTCAETLAMKLPAIFVPLPIGNGEQALNAEDQVRIGGAAVISDHLLTPDRLLAAIRGVRPKLAEMTAALERLPQQNGTVNLADLAEEAL